MATNNTDSLSYTNSVEQMLRDHWAPYMAAIQQGQTNADAAVNTPFNDLSASMSGAWDPNVRLQLISNRMNANANASDYYTSAKDNQESTISGLVRQIAQARNDAMQEALYKSQLETKKSETEQKYDFMKSIIGEGNEFAAQYMAMKEMGFSDEQIKTLRPDIYEKINPTNATAGGELPPLIKGLGLGALGLGGAWGAKTLAGKTGLTAAIKAWLGKGAATTAAQATIPAASYVPTSIAAAGAPAAAAAAPAAASIPVSTGITSGLATSALPATAVHAAPAAAASGGLGGYATIPLLGTLLAGAAAAASAGTAANTIYKNRENLRPDEGETWGQYLKSVSDNMDWNPSTIARNMGAEYRDALATKPKAAWKKFAGVFSK